ncbi:pyridoxamine 5'-phosphate oxidase family protein [Proteobacteria bacterium 005FR1]|nr:pyridoxamine 5'-phosphate oxidase family protein [Proteobacteria bacterium 005FR1]
MQTGSNRSRIRRGAKRASYDQEQIRAILRGNFLCHVAYTVDGESRVMPTAYSCRDEAVYLHGNLHNQMLNALLSGQTACLSVTEVNGLVLARCGLRHSVNYRSVILFGRAERVADQEKATILNELIDQLVPQRSTAIRPHLQKELDATLVVKIAIEEAAAKVREGPPTDTDEDCALDVWAGVVNLKTVMEVEPCPRLAESAALPAHMRDFIENCR